VALAAPLSLVAGGSRCSEQISEFRVGGDPGCGHGSGKRRTGVSARVVGDKGERSRIVIAVVAQGDVLDELGAFLGIAGGIIALPRNVIEVVPEPAGLGPDTEAEVSVLRRARGVHDFGAVTVPHDNGVIEEHPGSGNRVAVAGSGSKYDVPHSDDRCIMIVAIIEPGLDKGGIRYRERERPAHGLDRFCREVTLRQGTRSDHQE
jgi:hypothetical protein